MLLLIFLGSILGAAAALAFIAHIVFSLAITQSAQVFAGFSVALFGLAIGYILVTQYVDDSRHERMEQD